MKTLTTLAITTLFAITLSACAGETVYVHDSENGGAESGGKGGESSVKSEQEAAKGGAEAVTATTATEAPKPEPLCVPGASDECACPGGTKGAQVCAKDGQSYGVCECEPVTVVKTETVVETKTETVYVDKPVEVPVPPAGYSGECVYVGMSAATAIASVNGVEKEIVGVCNWSYPRLFVNCSANPTTEKNQCFPVSVIPGSYCCY